MPTIGFEPMVARNSFPFLPFDQGAATPCRDCLSAMSVGASSPIRFMSRELVAPPPVLGIRHESGFILRISPSQRRHRLKRRSWRHTT
jgi:hypothetical protein